MKKLSTNEIKTIVNNFLDSYHPDRSLPIPIEDIIEIKLNIQLDSKIDLKKIVGVDACVTSNFKTIIIDDHILNDINDRARFSLAHELAHYLLHQDFYNSLNIKDEESYIREMTNISEDDYKTLEREASICAGYLLVPEGTLAQEVKIALEESDLHHTPTHILKHKYLVSQAVIDIQMEKENISKDELIKSFIKKMNL